MKKVLTLILSLFIGISTATAQQTVMVGGEEMYPSRDIIENTSNSDIHTTLVAAVKAAGLVNILKGKGPFTVFAPTNSAFNKLPDGTVDKLLMDKNREQLSRILTYHVIAGKLDSKAVKKAINTGEGKAGIKTVSGDILILRKTDMGGLVIEDEKGNKANISTSDVYQSNGVIHVIDTVLMPSDKMEKMEKDKMK